MLDLSKKDSLRSVRDFTKTLLRKNSREYFKPLYFNKNLWFKLYRENLKGFLLFKKENEGVVKVQLNICLELYLI